MLFKKFGSLFQGTAEHIEAVNERRLDMLLEQTSLTGFFSVLFTFMLTLLMRETELFTAMSYWTGINLMMVLSREVFIYPGFRAKRRCGEGDPGLIRSVIIFFWLFAGMIWGAGGYLFLPHVSHPELIVTFMATYVGITSGNMISFAPSVLAGVVFTVPTMTGLAFRIHDYGYNVLFYSTLIYMMFLIIVIVRVSRIVTKAISLDLDNERLLKQVTEEKDRVEQEKDKAEKANLAKSEFIAAASHDLRQPLNSIGLFLFGLKQKLQGDSSDRLDLVGKMEAAHRALSEMFSTLLDMSNLDSGKVRVHSKSLQPSLVVQSVIDEFTEAASAKGLQINYTGNDAWIVTDEVLLSRIIRNLLDNAIKYTQQGHIQITETIEQGRLTITVEDTGIGIPEQELDSIFNEYHQVGNKRRDRREGVGLGLFITKRLCDLLGFDIHVSSTEGQGSTFTITSPVSVEPGLQTEMDAAAALPELKNIKVLVIDDDPDILNGMMLILEQWQCQVTTATDYQQALSSVAITQPDIILCDYRLQDDLTGVEALQGLEQQLGQSVPAIIITGEHLETVAAKIQEHGFNLLGKPVQPVQLHASITALLPAPQQH